MQKVLIAFGLVFSLILQANAADNYTATAGSGLTFAAKDNGSAVYFPRHIMCDNTTTTQCVAVNASGQITSLSVQSGTWTVQPGNTANTTPWLASISQGGSTAAVKAANTVASTDVGVVVAVANTNANVGNNANGVTPGASAGSPVVNYAYGYNAVSNVWDRPVLDPCERVAQSYAPISITTATTTRIVAPSASNKTYVCSLVLVTAAANNVGIVEGTGGTCGTGTVGVIGGTTAANGPNFSANGGLMLQAGGKVAAAQTAGTNVDLCLITSAATPLAGGIKYVQAP